MSLAVRDLSCRRHDRILFQGLNFAIRPGDIVQVEGANGSGKTSLLRMLCGILLPEEGQILWNDENIENDRPAYLSQVAYVGHHDGIKKELTPRENLRLVRALGSRPAKFDIASVLERVGLYGFEDVLTQTLSAGQRRRVALARLLVTDAGLWILDEPFTALDKHGRSLIEDLLEQHTRDDGMVILTTHQAINLTQARFSTVHLQ